MKRSRSLRNRILLPIVGGIVLYILMSVWANVGQLREAFSEFRLLWLPVVLALAFLNYVLRYGKFYYYLRVLDISLKPAVGFVVFLASFVMAITPGKLGEVLKSVFIKDLTGVPKSRTAPIVVAERITDLLAFIVLALIGIAGFTQERVILVTVLVVLVLIVAFCGLIGHRGFSLRLTGFLARLPVLRRLGPKLLTAYESTYVLITPKRLFWAVAISVPSWSCEVIAFYLVCHALGQAVPLGACFFIYSVGTILGAVAFLPGGLGLTEVSIAVLLVEYMPKAYAASATILIRLCTLWFAVLLGAAVIVLFQKQLGGRRALEELVQNDEMNQG